MARYTLFDKLGVPLKVKLDLSAVQDAESMLNMGLMSAAQSQIGPRFFTIILWNAVKWDQRDMSLDDLTKLMQKAIRAKKVTMYDIQRFVMQELMKSEAMTGYRADDDEDDVIDVEGSKVLKAVNPPQS